MGAQTWSESAHHFSLCSILINNSAPKKKRFGADVRHTRMWQLLNFDPDDDKINVNYEILRRLLKKFWSNFTRQVEKDWLTKLIKDQIFLLNELE